MSVSFSASLRPSHNGVHGHDSSLVGLAPNYIDRDQLYNEARQSTAVIPYDASSTK